MPAYRSEAEAEIRTEVVTRLRELIPGCRIIHEINACSFGNRIDVLAVGEDRLAAVEIKSAKDKLDRLPDQLAAMHGVSNMVYAAIHEKFLEQNRWGVTPPSEARGAVKWVYPKKPRKGDEYCSALWHEKQRWKKQHRCLPSGAIHMLWRKELQQICRDLGHRSTSKLNMPEAQDFINWNMNGEQLARAICGALLRRECVEADPPHRGEG